ncbi:type IV secretory system conjugative DNA transfer family protein [Streptomyces sp. NPDC005900]|uniref:type IV secretory system conjugative DNA transfer family protein n=1 Tax=Streptomyces sp. NPDC005900 TaxID=3154569 RepID=UPI0033E79B1A
MSSTTTPRADTAERAVALAQCVAPLATGILAPMLDSNAAALAGTAYLGAAGFIAANYMNRLGALTDHLPGMDILRHHGTTMFMSGLSTGMALGLGTLGGPDAADALLAGAATLPSVPGIVSLGWWAAVALVPIKLRRVLGRRKTTTTPGHPATVNHRAPNLTDAIMRAWAQHISHPEHGGHRHQVLTDVVVHFDTDEQTGRPVPVRWTGRILAPAGASVTVKHESVSSAFRTNPAWIDINAGTHAGEALISVSYKAPVDLDESTLEGAWKKRVARRLMPKTHLEQVTRDPNFDGESAYVCADDDLDVLTAPDRLALAGALRTSPLLVSYEPLASNPRKAIIRRMKENPLEKGHAFQGLDSLKMTKGGRFPVGRIISGHPAMLPAFDPALGGLHLVIAGTTGSGKGGAAQVVCLGYHANGAAIIYGDPKGSSNPAIPKMAAYSGVRQYGTLGALRISYAVLMHRIDESERLGLKNFQASKMRPWCPTVLDEAGQMLATGAPNRKEAVAIVKAGASLGRSFGMPWVLINQVVNLDQLGGEQAIRANLINGGAWLILRTDSGQTNLADLPDGFEGIDPGKIPAVWSGEEDSLVYDPELPEDDPTRTFGLGYLAAPGGRPGMMRIDMLEDATDHIRPDQVAIPEDYPDWSDAHLEEIANTPIPGFEDDASSDPHDSGSGPKYTAGVSFAKKDLSADEKILRALTDHADPLHVEALGGSDLEPDDYEITYLDKATLIAETGLNENTLNNTLNRLVKTAKIHRQPGVRGMYGLGPDPAPGQAGENAAA